MPFTANLLKDFQREHQRRYGYAHTARAVELVTLRLRAIVKSSKLGTIKSGDVREMHYAKKTIDAGEIAQMETAATGRQSRAKLGSPFSLEAAVLFDGKKLNAALYTRDTLKPGKKYSGPAIITEYSATTVISPGKRFHLDHASNLIVTIR